MKTMVRLAVLVAFAVTSQPGFGQIRVQTPRVIPIPPMPPAPPVAPLAPMAPVAPIAPMAPMAPLVPLVPMPLLPSLESMTEGLAEAHAALAEAAESLRGFAPRAFEFQDSASDAQRREADLYQSGREQLDRGRFDRAIDQFDQVIQLKGSRADGATYWKAYAQMKLGRRPEALDTLKAFATTFSKSGWLNDAKALEVEVRQSSGQAVNPDAADEDLKLLALNALREGDPDVVVPLLEKIVTGAGSPRVKERAMFVLARNASAQAREVISRVALGSGNPDLQLVAIRNLGLWSGNPDLQLVAIRNLGLFGVKDNRQVLGQIYASTASLDVKRAVLSAYQVSGDAERLQELARSEKDVALRRSAIRLLGRTKGATDDQFIQMYGTETDRQIRNDVMTALFERRNARALIDIARKETDPEMKKNAVRFLSTMKTKEATDYLMELLNK